MAELMAERHAGAGGVTATQVIARAGVPRRVFYESFVDRDACLLAAFELGVQRAGARMAGAYAAQSRWRGGVRVALATFLGFLEDEPALGRLCVLYAISSGPEVLRRRAEVLGLLAEVVDRGRVEGSAAERELPAVIADGIVGGVLSVIQNRLLAEERPPLMELFGSLMSMIALPYLGPAAARRELTRPPPSLGTGGEGAPGDGGKSASEYSSVRITYRTGRVLSAIAEYPGASNREVAERAGVVDQGQISKLLGRLEAHELIVNTGERSSRGAPNAWQLTELGQRVREASR